MANSSAAIATAIGYLQAGQFAAAEAALRQILAAEPRQIDALHLLGVAAHLTGNHQQAIESIGRAIRLNGRVAAFHNNLGEAQRALNRLPEAVASYRRALQLQRNYPDAHNNLGAALAGQGKPDEAIACFRQALRQKPQYAEAHNNLGNAWRDQGKLRDAVASYLRALDARPNYALALYNLGSAYHQLGELDQAVDCLRRAVELKPDFAAALNNLGNALTDRGDLAEATPCYAKAIELEPDFAEARVGRAVAILLHGDWRSGWDDYEYRLRLAPTVSRIALRSPWRGEPLAGKTILLRAEQGLGDTIQFIRYARQLQRAGARVALECQPGLLPLLQTCSDVDAFVRASDPAPEFDFDAALASLPGLLKTAVEDIPASVPYLAADSGLVEQWSRRLAGVDGLKVGVAWQGNRSYPRDRYRSIPLREFAPLSRAPGAQLISLQKGPGAEQLREVDFPILDLAAELDLNAAAFVDTAAVMMSLDLVVTSDTSLAHLAGALGRPVWVALPVAPDWRWLLGRADSPWYPTMRLFRQALVGDWAGPFEQIRAALLQFQPTLPQPEAAAPHG